MIIGAILRISFLWAVPEVFYGADSNSYFSTTKDLWLSGNFEVPAKRRYLYPLLLIPTPAIPVLNAVQTVAIVQHLVGLVTVVAVGWIVGHLVKRPKIWVIPVTILAAIWSRMLWYEHEMMAESLLLAAYIWTVALAFPSGVLSDRRRLFWFLVAAATIIALKPHGKPLWVALIFTAAVITRTPWRWGWKCFSVIAVSIVILATGGSGSQRAWLFLNSCLPFVKTEGEKWASYRAILKPHIEKARADLPNYAFNQSKYKKMLSNRSDQNPLGPEWIELARDREKFTEVADTLCREAVLGNPIGYTRLVLQKVMVVLSEAGGKKMDPEEFWKEQGDSNDGRWADAEKGATMKLLYDMDATAYAEMAKDRATEDLWFAKPLLSLNRALAWTVAEKGKGGRPPEFGLQIFGWLALLGLACCLTPKRIIPTSVLWMPPLFYLLLILAVGDSVTRYVHPVEWVGFIWIAIGLDRVLDLLASARAKLTPTRADVPSRSDAPASA